MMARLPFCLKRIDSRRVGGCQKPACKVSGTLQRHHKKHEAMWLGIWSGRRRTEPKWKAFVQRYHEFRPEDCVILCPDHHAEIHLLYDEIIQADRDLTNRNLADYTWRQAEILMAKLSDKCDSWLKTKSPGISSLNYARKRAQR